MEDKKPESVFVSGIKILRGSPSSKDSKVSDITIKDNNLARLIAYHGLVAGSANVSDVSIKKDDALHSRLNPTEFTDFAVQNTPMQARMSSNMESYNPVRNVMDKWIEGIKQGEGVKPLDPGRWSLHYSDEVIKMIEERRKKTNKYVVDYIVEVWYKYKCEHEYTKSYELFSYSFDDTSEWENDWFEGQEDIIYKRVVELDTILEYYFDHVKEEDNNGN